jgi:hypothetical protein
MVQSLAVPLAVDWGQRRVDHSVHPKAGLKESPSVLNLVELMVPS